MYPQLSYPLLEFNGTQLIELTGQYEKRINSNIKFEEHDRYYHFKNNNKKRKAAKLFYQLKFTCDQQQQQVEVYKVEIRWKGSIHNASPQFIIYKEYN